MFSSAAYAVNYNARCLVPQYTTGQWLVCTCGLYDKNEVTLLAFDEESGDLRFYNGYTCDITISKFSKTQDDFINPTYEIEIERAWPSIVAEIQLNHSGGNEVVRLPVTFQYKKWRQTV